MMGTNAWSLLLVFCPCPCSGLSDTQVTSTAYRSGTRTDWFSEGKNISVSRHPLGSVSPFSPVMRGAPVLRSKVLVLMGLEDTDCEPCEQQIRQPWSLLGLPQLKPCC